MKKYLVSFYNDQDVWLETVTIETESSDVKYIKSIAKKQSKYQIDRNCKTKVFNADK